MPKEKKTDEETQTAAAPPSKMELKCGGRALRLFMLFSNALLLIFSIGILAGASYNSQANVFVLLNTWFTPALVLGSFLLILSLLGGLGALTKSRCVLWIYVLLMFLVAIIDLIVASYALSRANESVEFVSDAFKASPEPLRDDLQQTFSCCGLNTYKDEFAVYPCPPGSGQNDTGIACLQPLAAQFRAYGTGVPTFGLILFFGLLVVIGLAWWLIRSIAAAIKESRVEML